MQLQAFGDNGQSFLYLSGLMRPQDVQLGVLIPDFTLTVIAAIALRRPAILLMAPFFPFMRILDSVICLMVLPRAYSAESSGVWVSPMRRIQGVVLELEEATAGATAGAGGTR
jgi:biofilm PGA synthesis N-glycosyltransferase PgaC